jgi:RNA polymerase sigma factor (sigma-70 family)
MPQIEDHVAVLKDAYPRLVAFARSKVGPELAEDVAQEAVMRLLRYRGVEDSQSLSLLLTIVHNIACNWVTRDKRRFVRNESMDDCVPVDTPSSELKSAHALADCWRSLPEKQRDILLLTEVKGLTEEQASLVLGISRSCVGSHRRAAVEKLKTSCNENLRAAC